MTGRLSACACQIPKPKSQNPNPKKSQFGIWTLGFGIWDLAGIEPPDGRRLDSTNQIFFHIVHVRRHAHGDQRRALSGFNRPEVVAEADRSGALARAALENRTRMDPG